MMSERTGGYSNFGIRIRSERTRLNLGQTDIAEPLGWKVNKVSDLERGETEPSRDDIESIAFLLGLDRRTVHASLLLANFQPNDEEVHAVRKVIGDQMDDFTFPVLLSDYTGRILDGNSEGLELASFTETDVREDKPYLIEKLADPSLQNLPGWDEEFLKHAAVYRMNTPFDLKKEWTKTLFGRLHKNPLFQSAWTRLSNMSTKEYLAPVAACYNELSYPVMNSDGTLEVKKYKQITTVVANDPRFSLEHFPFEVNR